MEERERVKSNTNIPAGDSPINQKENEMSERGSPVSR